jgi:hypothetical protein
MADCAGLRIVCIGCGKTPDELAEYVVTCFVGAGGEGYSRQHSHSKMRHSEGGR